METYQIGRAVCLATEAGKKAINISSPAHFAGMELSNLDVYLFALLVIYYKNKPRLWL
jgi:hypothetical protein